MAKWGNEEEWWALEQSKDFVGLIAQRTQADAQVATARATEQIAREQARKADAAERGAAAAERGAAAAEEHTRIQEEKLQMVKEERQLEQQRRQAKEEVFSLKLHADELMKAPGNDPLSTFLRLQMLSRELRLVPRQLLDDYGDKALHAEVSDRLNEGLGDLRAMAPSQIEALERVLTYGHMVGVSALALDAYWDLREIAPLRNKCKDLKTKLTGLERQIEAKRESASRVGHWVTFFIVMLAIMVTLLMITIWVLKNSSPAG